MSGRKRSSKKKRTGKIVLIVLITALVLAVASLGIYAFVINPSIGNKLLDKANVISTEAPAPTPSDDTNKKDEPEEPSDAPTADVASEEEPSASDNPALADDWYLILVNKDNPIPEGYKVPELTGLRNNQSVDSRIYPALQKMFDDARAQGIMPLVKSSYRTYEDQQAMMDNKIKELMDTGMSKKEASKEAKLWVAIPGTSEHQLGLSVDISTADWEKQDANIVWDWLNTHCMEYGFVQRYPENKVDITGINNEPWHYRYVTVPIAKEMYEKGLCLEEYLEQR